MKLSLLVFAIFLSLAKFQAWGFRLKTFEMLLQNLTAPLPAIEGNGVGNPEETVGVPDRTTEFAGQLDDSFEFSSSLGDEDINIVISKKQSTKVVDLEKKVQELLDRIARLEALSGASGPSKTFSGKTTPSDWIDYHGQGIKVYVDLTKYQFMNPPTCVCSLHGSNYIWETTGGSEIYDISKDGFNVYVRYATGYDDIFSDANSFGWHVEYVCQSQDY